MIGRTLTHFKIVSRIGEGGMGVVYKAERDETDGIVFIAMEKKSTDRVVARRTDK